MRARKRYFIWLFVKHLYTFLILFASDPYDIPERWFGMNYTPPQHLFWVLLGVATGVALFLTARDYRRQQKQIENTPRLLTAIDIRRGEIIQEELNKRKHSGDTQFVFNMVKDAWLILAGAKMPELPTKTGDEDATEILGILIKYASETKNGIKEMQKGAKKLGEIETGLMFARKVNKHLGIDDKLAKDSRNKKLMKNLKSAREHLPSAVAVETTKAMDSYLDFSRAYRAVDVVIIPLTEMVEENALLKGIPLMAQVIDKFQQYREKYLSQMNINLAKVNEALRDYGK